MKWIITTIICLGLVISYGSYKLTYEVVEVTVMDKERECTNSGETMTCRYMIHTDVESFENVDYLVTFKFNSSDFQRRVTIGESYRFHVVGIRSGFFSMYRNVIKIDEKN